MLSLGTLRPPKLEVLEVTTPPQKALTLLQAAHFPLEAAVCHPGNMLLLRGSLSTGQKPPRIQQHTLFPK